MKIVKKREDVIFMYDSFHFSPENNRTLRMLMPDVSKMQRMPQNTTPKSVNPDAPYAPLNTGIYNYTAQVGDITRAYAVYIPKTMTPKGPAMLILPDEAVNAADFIASQNWMELSERYGLTLIVLEADGKWDRSLTPEFDFIWEVIDREFGSRNTIDINESAIYPCGFGTGAYIAAAYAAVYSATHAAFAAVGEYSLAPELLALLRELPSDGIPSRLKSEVPIAGFLAGTGRETEEYFKNAINAKEEGLHNDIARVYREGERKGAYFVNDQPVAELWIMDKELESEALNEAIVRFVRRFMRWGGFNNNHLRYYRTTEEMGFLRQWETIDGLKRCWDVYVPSCYRADEDKKYPLVLAIHGGSCNMDYFEQSGDWYRLAEERGFFLVYIAGYPQSAVFSLNFPLPAWSSGGVVAKGNDKNVDDRNYVNFVLDKTIADYSIDTTRMYAMGHSNGSAMTQHLMRIMPERFAAFNPTGAMGAIMQGEPVSPMPGNVKRPVWFVMGEYDITGGELIPGEANYETIRFHCDMLGLDITKGVTYENGKYRHFIVKDEDGVPLVRFTRISECPHVYTPEMAQMAWDDFLCHYSRSADGSIHYVG